MPLQSSDQEGIPQLFPRMIRSNYGVQPESETNSEQNSPPSTVQSSRSPTPEMSSSTENILNIYLERLGVRKPVFTTQLRLQTQRRRHINDLPIDVMAPIVGQLVVIDDLMSFMLVQRSWLLLGASRIWYKPLLHSKSALQKICSVLASENQSVDYASLITRLNLSQVAKYMTDFEFQAFLQCRSVDRLVLVGCSNISARLLGLAVAAMPRLHSIDLQGVNQLNDDVLRKLAENCPDLQIFYGGGDSVTDEGLNSLLAHKVTLRRLILSRCSGVTPQGVINLVSECKHLVELDLTALACFKGDRNLALMGSTEATNTTNIRLALQGSSTGFSNEDTRALLSNCIALRDLRLDGSSLLNASGFSLMGTRAISPRMDSLRVLSLAMCTQLNDSAIAQIIETAPRIRHLNLSKCSLITDRGVSMIAEAYGAGLHHLHLGHCTKITDRSVLRIAESCPRLTFFDAANCSNLTNISLIVLAKLPKLRRIGVVKCNDIGAPGVMALAQRPLNFEGERPIERLHLSYCSSISVIAIKMVLDACPRLAHLSLTGVHAFMRSDVMRLSRPPPPELNEHQRQVFCVFSGSGIQELREVLNQVCEPPRLPAWSIPSLNTDQNQSAIEQQMQMQQVTQHIQQQVHHAQQQRQLHQLQLYQQQLFQQQQLEHHQQLLEHQQQQQHQQNEFFGDQFETQPFATPGIALHLQFPAQSPQQSTQREREQQPETEQGAPLRDFMDLQRFPRNQALNNDAPGLYEAEREQRLLETQMMQFALQHQLSQMQEQRRHRDAQQHNTTNLPSAAEADADAEAIDELEREVSVREVMERRAQERQQRELRIQELEIELLRQQREQHLQQYMWIQQHQQQLQEHQQHRNTESAVMQTLQQLRLGDEHPPTPPVHRSFQQFHPLEETENERSAVQSANQEVENIRTTVAYLRQLMRENRIEDNFEVVQPVMEELTQQILLQRRREEAIMFTQDHPSTTPLPQQVGDLYEFELGNVSNPEGPLEGP